MEHALSASGLDDAHAYLAHIDRDALAALYEGFARTPLRYSFFGRKRVEQALIDAMAKQLLLRHHQARTAALETLPLAPAIAIVAPFRSGTTLLQRLLAQDPATRFTRSWEVFQAPPAVETLRNDPRYFSDDARVAGTRRFVSGLRRHHSRLVDLHPPDADSAEECFGLLETSLRSHSFMLHGAIEGYLPWLDQLPASAWEGSYADYADQLRLLQWWSPAEAWVLKSPFHLWQLGALVRSLKPRLVVQIHRDPTRCVVSFCELLQATFESLAAPADPHWIGGVGREALRHAVQRSALARRQLDPALFLDVDYRQLMDDPLEVVRLIYRRAGFELTERAQDEMQQWLREGKLRPRRTRHADAATFGLSPSALEEDFADYADFFG